MKTVRYTLFFVFCLEIFNLHAKTIPRDTIQVGYVGSAPFVIEEENPKGIVFDIWKEVVFSLKSTSSFQHYESVENGIAAVRAKKVDVLIGPITINSSRANSIVFSQPYYDTEMAILAPIMELSFWDHVKPFFSKLFFFAVVGLLLVLSVVGLIFWLVEGRHFPEIYHKNPVKGVGAGIWLAIVTMTTVGYGDYAPKTGAGRFVIGSWMIISLILATSFVAGIASTFSATNQNSQTITSLNQLENKIVAAPSNREITQLLRSVGAKPFPVHTAGEAYKLLLKEEVDAILYDEIPLQYVFVKTEKERFRLSKKNIAPQHYGFAFPIDGNLERKVSMQIIQMMENHDITDIVQHWISKN